MKTWTKQAKQRLGEYLRERAMREDLEAEDAVELKEDLRRHVYEEAEKQSAEVIGWVELEVILGDMDSGYRSVAAPTGEWVAGKRRQSRFWAWTCGVVLPAVVIVFEALLSWCGDVFFDPIPTWWHLALVAMVPGLNAWLLKDAPGGREEWKGAAAGVALIVAGFYGLLFLPLVHISFIALIFFGIGLLSLTAITAWIASWLIGRRLKRESLSPKRFRKGWLVGAAAAVLALVALEAPAAWTRANLSTAAAGGEGEAAAISRLRMFGSERTLLEACYEINPGFDRGTDIAGWLGYAWRIPLSMVTSTSSNEDVNPEAARDVFFRVTGKPFNSMKPPGGRKSFFRRGAIPMDEMEFDDHIGGDEVAVRLKSLDLKESRFDGHVDSVSRVGYGEWTMVFRNVSHQSREARCQVKLPRGGRVSRLTLWVNGEPREAAFSTVSKVKAAYQEVAVRQQRDPVLVTMAGPDTVMVQCFPVPGNGEMKIRFGITAELDGRRWELPRIVERNFGTAKNLEHAVWLQADKGFDLRGMKDPLSAAVDGPGRSLAATLDAVHAMGEGVTMVMEPLADEAAAVWCEDPFADEAGRFLVREPYRRNVDGSEKVVLVIDGSVSVGGSKDWLVKAMDDGVIAVLADDAARRITPGDLKGYEFSGGRDNEPALREAIQISKAQGGLPIVWVHGPQAVKVSQSEALLQLLERGSVLPSIHEVEVAPGPNRLAEAVYRSGVLKRGPNLLNPAEDFRAFIGDLRSGTTVPGWVWRRSESADGLEGMQVWDQLARLWGMGVAEDPFVKMKDDERSGIAAKYQLVTAVSGAVVLETQEQYESNGLEPVDPNAAPHMPTVPEPSTAVLILLTVGAGLLRRKR